MTANQLLIQGESSLQSMVYGTSSQVGSIVVTAPTITLLDGGFITIQSESESEISPKLLTDFVPQTIKIDTERLTLRNRSWINAGAFGNQPAADIKIKTTDRLDLDNSIITTSANTNDGGSITLTGTSAFSLRNSRITTSTEGGNGGDINIRNEILFMDTGFIQANTTVGAKGGNIAIDVPYLITSYGLAPQIGGERAEFKPNSGRNIIQAAAPEGNPGEVNLSNLTLDLSGALLGAEDYTLEEAQFAPDPCSGLSGAQVSSLVAAGRGGVPRGPVSQHKTLYLSGAWINRLSSSDADSANQAIVPAVATVSKPCTFSHFKSVVRNFGSP